MAYGALNGELFVDDIDLGQIVLGLAIFVGQARKGRAYHFILEICTFTKLQILCNPRRLE